MDQNIPRESGLLSDASSGGLFYYYFDMESAMVLAKAAISDS